MKSKRTAGKVAALCAFLCCVWFYNNLTVKTDNIDFYSEKITYDLKITVISDLHGLVFGKNNSILLNKIKKTKPDLIFVLGDMYSTGSESGMQRAVELYKNLSEIAEVYCVTGEHDNDEHYKFALNGIDNVHLMNYRKSNLNVKGNELCIYGIDNIYFTDTFDLHNEFKAVDSTKFNILLAHIPNGEAYGNFNTDLIFSGDTHGGIIRLPVIGALYYDGKFFPKYTYGGRITDKGLFKFGDTNIFVTSGLGGYPVLMRFCNRPEICSITLKGILK